MIDYFALGEQFHPSEVKWRVGSTTKDKTKGIGLAYVDARTVMDRLDHVVGPQFWQDSYTETASGRVICSLSIFDGEWITKSDGAGDTSYEGEKGAISDAFKRAAVKFGIGRYLHELPNSWFELKAGGKQFATKPDITNYTTNSRNTHAYRYGMALQEHFESIAAIKAGIAGGDLSAASEAYFELDEDTRMALNKAATKGGIFTTQENEIIRSTEFRETFYGS